MSRPDWLPSELFSFVSRFADVGGNRVHYVDEGSGPTVLFVHGNPDYSLLYRHQIEDLRADYRCVALDMPGFGLSTPADGFGFTPAEQVAVLLAFIEQIDILDAVLVVHDWGGPIGLRAAQLGSARFTGLVIAGTLAWRDYRRRSPWWVRAMMGYLGGERGKSFTLKNNLILEGPLRSEMNKGDTPPSDAAKEAYRGPFLAHESRLPTWVLANHLWTKRGDAFLGTLERGMATLGHLPVLLIAGASDAFTPAVKMLPRFGAIFANHEEVVIPGAGHFFPESAGPAMTTAVRNWLGRTRA